MRRIFCYKAFKDCSSKGFTLIEVLVIISILTVVVGGAVANYWRLNERKLVEGAAKQAEQALRDAQKQASAGVKPDLWCTDPETLVSYVITMGGGGIGDDVYQIEAVCSDAVAWPNEVARTDSLPEGTRYRSLKTVTFAVLGQAATSETICVENDAGSVSYSIDVDQGGAVTFSGNPC